MRQWIWRRLFAAATVAIVMSGTAPAQDRTPPPPLAIPVASSVSAEAATGPTAPTVPTASPAPIAPPAEGVIVPPSTGHHPIGTAARGFVMESSGGYYGSNCLTGQACNNGCGSLQSDCKFMFGSCKSFFSPCGPRLGHGGGFGAWLDSCRTPIYGTGPLKPFDPCCYDSYLNH